MNIKVLSWNIWQGYHLDTVIADLKKINADIIGLQEVIEKDGTNIAQQIANKLGYQCVYFRAVDKTRLGYPQGNAIITRYPILESSGHLLSTKELFTGTAETEPRIAVKTKINVEGRTLDVITVHLAYSHMFQNSSFRDMQVANLTTLIPHKKTILLGDFNSHPDSSYMSDLNKVMRNTDSDPKEPTWTVYPFDYEGFIETELKHRLDYIFTTFDLKSSKFKVLQSMGSDHLPVEAMIDLP